MTMVTLYWFALIVGGGILGASLFGDLFGADIDDPDTGDDAHGAKILSLRNLTYFLFAFGATGVALNWIAPVTEAVTGLIAGAVGIAAAAAAALLLNYVQRTESGERAAEDSFVGCTGRLTLPFGDGHAGRVMIRRGDREFELRARPFDSDSTRARIGTGIIVVEMDGGTALVAPVEESLPAAGVDT
jgi:membrane protein implicated in regulation of membrane protease activity